jgi:septum formation topological specificity factor MinE
MNTDARRRAEKSGANIKWRGARLLAPVMRSVRLVLYMSKLEQYKKIISDTVRLMTMKDILEDRIKPDYMSVMNRSAYEEILAVIRKYETLSLEKIQELEKEIGYETSRPAIL